MTSIRLTLATVLALSSTACPGPDADDETTGASADTGGTTDATDSQTSGTGSSASGSASGSATSTTGPTTAGTDSATTTTGNAQGACEAYCQHIVECLPDEEPYLEECLDECTFISQEGDAACQSAYADFFNCIAMLDCAAFEGNVAYCVSEEEAIELACVGDEACEGYVGIGEGGCEYGEICPEAGERRMFCDSATATCTCYEDDVEVGTCPLEQACEDLDITGHAATCCGWDL